MPHISYSELKNWEQCPYKHKLVNIDKINNFTGNEYTAFGTALHSVCESLLTENKGKDVDEGELFVQEFRKEIKKLDVELRKEMIISMFEQGTKIAPIVIPYVMEHFGDIEVFSVEEKLYEDIEGLDYKFKGFIDFVFKTDDGKLHVYVHEGLPRGIINSVPRIAHRFKNYSPMVITLPNFWSWRF